MRKFNDVMGTIFWIAAIAYGVASVVVWLYDSVKDKIHAAVLQGKLEGYEKGFEDAENNAAYYPSFD